jgi:hypothetical protein
MGEGESVLARRVRRAREVVAAVAEPGDATATDHGDRRAAITRGGGRRGQGDDNGPADRSSGEGGRECCRTSGGRWVCHQKEDGGSRSRGGQAKLQKKAAKITPAAEKAAQRPPRPRQEGPPTIQTAIRRLTVGRLPMGGRIEGGGRDGNQ